jgi:hypothetical protein
VAWRYFPVQRLLGMFQQGVSTKVHRPGPPNKAGLRDLIEVLPEAEIEAPILPRYVQMRRLADGGIGYYWCRPWWARGRDCPLRNEALGKHLDNARDRSGLLNAQLDAWRIARRK